LEIRTNRPNQFEDVKMPRIWSVILLAFTFATPSGAAHVKYQMDCDLGKGTTQTQRSGGSTVILTPSNGMCRVSVLDAEKAPVFEYAASGMQVYVGVGVTTDGTSNAVIQADNPPKLFVVSLGERPRLLRTIENQYGFWLQNDCDGRIRIWTLDGSFQNDPDLADVYHGDLFTPDVVLELQGKTLVDATPKCRVYFDQEIESLRSSLKERDIQKFQAHQVTNSFDRGQIKGKILKATFCYLYTGREAEAKQFLQQTWPNDDRDRLWRSILRLRSEGVLRSLKDSH
jgi:hypothetical protein